MAVHPLGTSVVVDVSVMTTVEMTVMVRTSGGRFVYTVTVDVRTKVPERAEVTVDTVVAVTVTVAVPPLFGQDGHVGQGPVGLVGFGGFGPVGSVGFGGLGPVGSVLVVVVVSVLVVVDVLPLGWEEVVGSGTPHSLRFWPFLQHQTRPPKVFHAQ